MGKVKDSLGIQSLLRVHFFPTYCIVLEDAGPVGQYLVCLKHSKPIQSWCQSTDSAGVTPGLNLAYFQLPKAVVIPAGFAEAEKRTLCTHEQCPGLSGVFHSSEKSVAQA
ncbi:hypothetical protein KIL84_004073 [Mauremys mutica]|uniref:Uncharacterized protein n=1 Tax=Mauremys mutica TaxID=74926 RepID=A0A9D4B6L2_9SAUR|nr:hypothetical protein KIL84_004073 [Mauremys mutica]